MKRGRPSGTLSLVETLLVRVGIANEHSKAERERRDEREWLAGPTPSGVSTGNTSPLKSFRKRRELALRKVLDGADQDALLGECRAQISRPHFDVP